MCMVHKHMSCTARCTKWCTCTVWWTSTCHARHGARHGALQCAHARRSETRARKMTKMKLSKHLWEWNSSAAYNNSMAVKSSGYKNKSFWYFYMFQCIHRCYGIQNPVRYSPFNAMIVLNVRAAFHRNQTFTFSWQKYFAIQRFPCSDLTIPNWKAAPRNFSCGQPLATMGRPRGAWQILPMGQNKQEWIIIEALW